MPLTVYVGFFSSLNNNAYPYNFLFTISTITLLYCSEGCDQLFTLFQGEPSLELGRGKAFQLMKRWCLISVSKVKMPNMPLPAAIDLT